MHALIQAGRAPDHAGSDAQQLQDQQDGAGVALGVKQQAQVAHACVVWHLFAIQFSMGSVCDQ